MYNINLTQEETDTLAAINEIIRENEINNRVNLLFNAALAGFSILSVLLCIKIINLKN